jgi:hypothetical protein
MIRLLRDLSKLPLFLPVIIVAISAASLLLWEFGRLVPGPTGEPWGRWSRLIPRLAIGTTTCAVILMGLRFAHVAGVF